MASATTGVGDDRERQEAQPHLVGEVQGLGITAVTGMMLALAPGRRLRTIELEEELRRDVVLITRTGDEERPTMRAVREVIEAALLRDEGRDVADRVTPGEPPEYDEGRR